MEKKEDPLKIEGHISQFFIARIFNQEAKVGRDWACSFYNNLLVSNTEGLNQSYLKPFQE